MTDDDKPPPDATDQSLFGALCEGDAGTAGKLLKARKCLSQEEIELIADLLLGEANRKHCSHRLVFERWGRGRPTDHLEQRAKSQERARAIDREVQNGVKLEAALQDISDRANKPISTLKKDRQLYKRLQPKK